MPVAAVTKTSILNACWQASFPLVTGSHQAAPQGALMAYQSIKDITQ